MKYRMKLRQFIKGKNGENSVFAKFIIYALLIGIGFVFLYPIIYMLSFSMKGLEDQLNAFVNWIPTTFYLENFKKAYIVLNFVKTLGETVLVAVVPALIQMFMCAMIGYGFGLYNFRGKKILLALVLLTFVIPNQVTVIPQYILFNKLGILGSIFTYILPATFGQGINSAIFILIFFQNYRTIPKALVEAARLDGANEFTIFTKIGLPIGIPSFIITFLFSLVWYWNETYLASIYFGKSLTTLPLQLENFVAAYKNLFPEGADMAANALNEGIELAATLLTILPLLVIYFVAQKWFVESIDKSGITGE